MSAAEGAKLIRQALKARGFTGSVRKGAGTASRWIYLRGSGQFGEFAEGERRILDGLGLPYGSNFMCFAPYLNNGDAGFTVDWLFSRLGL